MEPLGNSGLLLIRPQGKASLLRSSSFANPQPQASWGRLLSAKWPQGLAGTALRGGKWERPRGSLLGPSGLSLRTGDRLCVRGDGEQGPGSHHLSFPGRGPAGLWSHSAWGWAPANRQQQRLLGGFSFKQKRTLSGNMCLFSPSASLPPFPSPFCFQIFLFFGASLSVCFPLSCSICLSVSLF